MEKSFLAYNEKYVLGICSQASQNFISKRYLLPAGSFGDIGSSRIHYFVLNSIKLILENRSKKSEILVHYYNDNTIFVMELDGKMREIMVLFPYERYAKYLPVIKRLNDLVGKSGAVLVFANKNPYSLEAGVFISTAEKYDEIMELVRINDLTIDSSRELRELDLDMWERRNNSVGLTENMTLSEIEDSSKPIFLWTTKMELENKDAWFKN